ncbi:MAG: mercuric transporter MerT family protein [Gemmatimonadaceae bacterium]
MRKTLFAGLSGIVAALLGSLCCAGPLLFVAFGIGAGLAGTFEPLRPVFGVAMFGSLAMGFWAVYGGRVRQPAPAADGSPPGSTDAVASACAAPTRRRRDVFILWSATVVALILWTYPTWSTWLL